MNRSLAILIAILWSSVIQAWDLDARFKAFGTVNDLPDDDILGEFSGSPAWDGNLDLRLLFRENRGPWELIVDHTTIGLGGDTFEFNEGSRGAVDQTPTDDERRALELTWTLERDDRYRLYHRFDRLAVQYRGDSWGITLGREAVSWGSGKAFNPMDVFAPFAPTTVDRDYKAGEDLLKFDKLFDGGSDLQLLAVFRRDEQGDREFDEGSYGGKFRSFIGETELEIAAGRHFDDDLLGLTYRFPIGGALVQSDWIATHLDEEDEWKVSGVVNIDYSFQLAGRTTYVFAEYYRNGFGRNGNPIELGALPDYLTERLQRGEVFSLMKDYLAAGGSYQWHPLITQSTTLLWNLHDNSSLLQSNLSFEPSDQQRLEAGVTLTVGERGEEYGRIALAEGLTTGGGGRFFLRWLYFW